MHSEALHNLQDLALRILADKVTLQHINTELIEKQKRQRQGKEKKSYSKVRVLLVQETLQKNQEWEEKEQAKALKKKCYWILYSKVGFAKKVLNKLPLETDLFV